jgi:hypothetical protein
MDEPANTLTANLPRCTGVVEIEPRNGWRQYRPCIGLVKYACGSLCEDCYADAAAKYHGRDQLVKTMTN